MELVTVQQLKEVEELGIQKLVLPSMSSFEVRKIIDGEKKSRSIRESRIALKDLLQSGLHCGCEVEQILGAKKSRWGVVYKISEKTGTVGLYINDGRNTAQADAKALIVQVFEKDETMVYVPKDFQKDILRGKYGEVVRSAIQSRVLPKTKIQVCFLPIEFAKALNF